MTNIYLWQTFVTDEDVEAELSDKEYPNSKDNDFEEWDEFEGWED